MAEDMAYSPARRFDFAGRDGLRLTYRELGSGRPLILLHGFSGSGQQWLDYGAATLAERGCRVILPDFRGHTAAARPSDAASYPPDVLADDTLALIDHLGFAADASDASDDYHLGGYSLGGRIVVRALARGARPARAVVAGQGLGDVTRAAGTGLNHRVLTALARGETLEPGSPEAQAAYWFGQGDIDPQALLYVLESLVATADEAVRQIPTPTLVAVGDEDYSHGTGEALADALPRGRFTPLAGNHWTAMTGPGLVAAICEYLDEVPAG
jgi:pimeloyl-ACP methyl ester carboxylesterase